MAILAPASDRNVKQCAHAKPPKLELKKPRSIRFVAIRTPASIPETFLDIKVLYASSAQRLVISGPPPTAARGRPTHTVGRRINIEYRDRSLMIAGIGTDRPSPGIAMRAIRMPCVPESGKFLHHNRGEAHHRRVRQRGRRGPRAGTGIMAAREIAHHHATRLRTQTLPT